MDRYSPKVGLGRKFIKCVALLQQQDKEYLEGEEVDAGTLGLDRFGYSERLHEEESWLSPCGECRVH